MNKLLFIIKVVVFIEVALIALFILINYAAKIYYVFKVKRQKKDHKKIKTILMQLSRNQPIDIDIKTTQYLQRNIFSLLTILSLPEWEQLPSQKELQQSLSEAVLKPSARRLATSKNWFNQYLASNCFSYGFDLTDEAILLTLIESSSLLVSLNASLAILKRPSRRSIDKIIDVYTKGRQLQQSSFAAILTKEAPAIKDMVEKRLTNERDTYVKVFCYRLLSALPIAAQPIRIASVDITSDNIDLKIAALSYLSHFNQENIKEAIRPFLNDPHWQVRATMAKLLGQLADKKAILALSNCLKDSEWWVRINAAQALSKLGPQGIAILKAQEQTVDRYAYESAQQALITINRT